MNDKELVVLSQPIKVGNITVYPISGYRWGIITTFDLLPIKTSVQADTIAYILTHDRLEIAANLEKLADVAAEFTDSITAEEYNDVLNIMTRNLAGINGAQEGLSGGKKKVRPMDRLRLIWLGWLRRATVSLQKRLMSR